MLTRTTLQNTSNKVSRRNPHSIPGSPPLAGTFELMGAPMSFGRNSEIYGEGEPADYVYKVVCGTVRTSKILADGRRQIGSFYLPGDVFGLEIGDDHSFSAEAIMLEPHFLLGFLQEDAQPTLQDVEGVGDVVVVVPGDFLLAREPELADAEPRPRGVRLPCTTASGSTTVMCIRWSRAAARAFPSA